MSIGALNIKHMLLNALLDLADTSFILLKLLSGSQAIEHMETCEKQVLGSLGLIRDGWYDRTP